MESIKTTQQKQSEEDHPTRSVNQTKQTDSTTNRATRPSEVNTCSECDGSVKQENGEEWVCQDCGLIIAEDRIDPGPDWRAFNSEDRQNRRRVGSPVSEAIHDKGLSTTLGHGGEDTDVYGQSLSGNKRFRLNRLRRLNKHSISTSSDAGSRSVKKGCSEIARMASALDLPDDVKKSAAKLYRDAHEGVEVEGSEADEEGEKQSLIVGQSIEQVASAVLFIACRNAEVPRTLDGICRISRAEDRSGIGRAYRHLSAKMDLAIKIPKPKQFVPRICSQADVPHAVERLAVRLLDLYETEKGSSGKSPQGLAAGAIYAANEHLDTDTKVCQARLAKITDMTDATVRENYQQIGGLDRLDAVVGSVHLNDTDDPMPINSESVREKISNTQQSSDDSTSSETNADSEDVQADENSSESNSSGSTGDAEDNGSPDDGENASGEQEDIQADSESGKEHPDPPVTMDDDRVVFTSSEAGEWVVESQDSPRQSTVMHETVKFLAEYHGLIDAIEDLPYAAPGCSNYLLVSDSEQAENQSGTWKPVPGEKFVNTKLSRGDKERRMRGLAAKCGIELSVEAL